MPIYPTAPLTSSIPAPVSVVQPVSYAQPVTYAQPVQYVPQPVQYVPQPVQYVPQPVVQQPVIAQPILTQSVVAAPQQAPIKGESRVEYREFQRPVVEMETETIQVQVPKTKYVTDYYPVEYQTEYIPRTVYEQQTEYVPVTKTVPRVEYDAVEREVQRVQYQPVQTVPVQPVVQSYVQPVQSYVQPVQPLTYSVARPIAQAPVYAQPVVAPALTYSGVRPAYAPVYPSYPQVGARPQQAQQPVPSNKPQ
uniref:EPI24 protein n=1 Tax=Paramecium tetraurelia TaxID=5888 RepID=Q3SDF5_PARTE|nr:EPI24 [Paramecium tetraurelia]